MIHGSVVALVTPMTASGAIDHAALARLVEFHIAAGTHGIVAVGTTGESPTLDHDEHIGVIAEVVRLVEGRIPVIGGTGANSTSEAIELTRAAADAGVDACLLVTPYYNKPPQEGLYRHFRAVAEAVAIPQILYNVPGRTACDLQTDTVLRLAEIPNIVGLKDATGSLEKLVAARTAALTLRDQATQLQPISPLDALLQADHLLQMQRGLLSIEGQARQLEQQVLLQLQADFHAKRWLDMLALVATGILMAATLIALYWMGARVRAAFQAG